MINYRGSSYDGVGHGYGKLSTPNWFHIGWFEFGKPMGFGTRVYTSLNQVDIGLWEGDTLVKFASVFENGMKYQLTQIIEEHLSFLEDDGVDYSEFLKSPNYPAKTFSMPSKSSLLVTSTSAIRMAHQLHRDLPSDMDPYIQENDLPMPNDVYQKQVTEWMNGLIVHAKNIINDESCVPVQDFWHEIVQKNQFNEKVEDKKHMKKTIENLKSKMEQGPQTRQIIAAFRSIENRDFNYLLMCLRRGVHVGSRDVTNYSLLHCASIFADARALNTLIKAGSIFFQSYHFTPLNISLLLYYRRQLDEILKIKIIPKYDKERQKKQIKTNFIFENDKLAASKSPVASIKNSPRPKSGHSEKSANDSAYGSLHTDSSALSGSKRTPRTPRTPDSDSLQVHRTEQKRSKRDLLDKRNKLNRPSSAVPSVKRTVNAGNTGWLSSSPPINRPMTASPGGKGRKKNIPNKDDNYTFRRGNFANRPMTASTLGGMDDDTLSLGTNQTDQLSCASIEKNYCRIIKLLIHNGIPKYEIKCPFVLPEIFWPILASDPKMLDRLILAGCDVNATLVMNNLVLKGLHWAAETHPRVVASLISSRLNPNDQIEKTKQENHKFGVSFADNYKSYKTSNALVRCIIAGKIEQLKQMIAFEGNVNNSGEDYSPLGLGILHGHLDVVKLLLKAGAKPNHFQRSRSGVANGTAMAVVIHPRTDSKITLREKVELIDTLVEYGANLLKVHKYRTHPNMQCSGRKGVGKVNSIDFIGMMLAKSSSTDYSGSFGSMKEDEKRNYLARKELQNYLVSIAREQLQVLLDANQDATVACFECCRASKELTVDKHFKKIAFCGLKCRKAFWKANPSREKILSRRRKKFPFETFYLKTDLKENYSFN